MARKLPWTASTSSNKFSVSKSSSTSSHPIKRVKVEPKPKDEESEQDLPSIRSNPTTKGDRIPPTHNDSHLRRRGVRSPSTSPPPAPPPSAELMRPGLDADDVYMLVEDEFQAMAQSYTAHLHHAEYRRLMKVAREKKAERQRAGTDFLGGEKIPKDLSGETRQHLKRKLLEERQSSGVKSMLGPSMLNASDEDSASEEADEVVLAREEKKVGDMWAGTALGGLMSWDHSQEKTSLKGLDKIGGETRASKGFGPSARRGHGASQRGLEDTKELREKGSKIINDGDTAQVAERVVKGESTASNQPRNNTSFIRYPSSTTFHKKLAAEASSSSLRARPALKDEVRRSKADSRLAKPSRSKYRSFVDSLDDFDDAAFTATKVMKQSGSSGISQSKPIGGRDAKQREKSRRERLDEVPVFLV